MQSKELLLLASQQCAVLVLPLLEDLITAPLVTPLRESGNHGHWILGHLAFSEGQFRYLLDGSPHPHEAWRPLFGGGSIPSPTGEGYPPYEELLDHLKTSQTEMLAWISTMTEEDLDRASQIAPPGMDLFFGTWRQVLLMRSLHWMNHRGQLADCRQAAGRPALFL